MIRYMRRRPEFNAIYYDGDNYDEVAIWAAQLNRKNEVKTKRAYAGYQAPPATAKYLYIDDEYVIPGTWLVWEGVDVGVVAYDDHVFRYSFEESTYE